MTSIQSSLMPYYSSGITASQLSASQMLSSQLGLQQTQGGTNSNDLFSDAYSLSLSNAALGMFGSGDAGTDSAESILNSLTYSNYSGASQGTDNGISSLFESLAGLGSGSAPIIPTSLTGPSFEQAIIADGGPLPAFLAYVDKQMNLSSTQQQALQHIADENMGIPGDTPAVVQQIAAELQQAGIPETI